MHTRFGAARSGDTHTHTHTHTPLAKCTHRWHDGLCVLDWDGSCWCCVLRVACCVLQGGLGVGKGAWRFAGQVPVKADKPKATPGAAGRKDKSRACRRWLDVERCVLLLLLLLGVVNGAFLTRPLWLPAFMWWVPRRGLVAVLYANFVKAGESKPQEFQSMNTRVKLDEDSDGSAAAPAPSSSKKRPRSEDGDSAADAKAAKKAAKKAKKAAKKAAKKEKKEKKEKKAKKAKKGKKGAQPEAVSESNTGAGNADATQSAATTSQSTATGAGAGAGVGPGARAGEMLVPSGQRVMAAIMAGTGGKASVVITHAYGVVSSATVRSVLPVVVVVAAVVGNAAQRSVSQSVRWVSPSLTPCDIYACAPVCFALQLQLQGGSKVKVSGLVAGMTGQIGSGIICSVASATDGVVKAGFLKVRARVVVFEL